MFKTFFYLLKKKKEKQTPQKNRGNVDRGFWMYSILKSFKRLLHSFIVVLILILIHLLAFLELFKLFNYLLLLWSRFTISIKPLKEKEGDQHEDGSANTRPLSGIHFHRCQGYTSSS